jgi:hypothetical protein
MLLGCSIPPRAHISSSQIPIDKIGNIKNLILSEAFRRYDNTDDAPHCVDYINFKDCYFLTRYIKEFDELKPGTRFISIGLSYKEFDYSSDHYRNMGIHISQSRGDDSDLYAELTRIENLIFKEVAKVSDGKVKRRKD